MAALGACQPLTAPVHKTYKQCAGIAITCRGVGNAAASSMLPGACHTQLQA